VGAWALLSVFPRGSSAQEGCVFGDEGNDEYVRQTVPGGGSITYVRRPHFVCDDGVQIWADSAVAYSAEALSHLIGRVRYRDRERELTASEARYFSNTGRLQASGRVVVTDRVDGSRVENGDLVYLRRTDFREEESMTFTTGRDGARPRASVAPPRPDSTDGEPAPASPYTVVGDRLWFRGSSAFTATGSVEIERDSLFAFADSAEYDEASERLVLVGGARVASSSYDLVGRTITIGTASSGPSEIRAQREARLTGEDLLLVAPEIRLYLADGRLERLVAVPLAGKGRRSDPLSVASTEPSDSVDLSRPVAVAEQFRLTADSLELTAPQEVVERIFAAGSARSVSEGRDSLNVEALPELARRDWLEGDTIVITLAPRARTDSSAGTPARDRDTVGGAVNPIPASDAAPDGERKYQIERIVARVHARSLYRLPPEDTTARAGVDLPAVHYVVGDTITIYMRDGEVEAMEVVGQTRGVHLEPLGRRAPVAPDSLASPSDSVRPAPPIAAGPRVPDGERRGEGRLGGGVVASPGSGRRR
jgi:lipopolysaccharide export system protein LptA